MTKKESILKNIDKQKGLSFDESPFCLHINILDIIPIPNHNHPYGL